MVKPILVPSSAVAAPSGAVASAAAPPPPPPPPPRPNAISVKIESVDEGTKKRSEEEAPAETAAASVDFSDVFAELQRYRDGNGGSLVVPASDPAMSRIIDGLADVEGLSRKRWEGRLEALRQYGEGGGDVNDVSASSHPDLARWAAVQRRQLELHRRKVPSSLTKKRVKKLRDVGFGVVGGEKEAATEATNVDTARDAASQNQPRKEGNGSNGKKENGISVKTEANGATAVSAVLPAANVGGSNGAKVAATGGQESNGKSKEKDASQSANSKKAKEPKVEVGEASGKKENATKVKTEANSAAATSAVVLDATGKIIKYKGKCDVCEKKDGFWDHNMQRCRDCGVLVHELCYGVPETDAKDPDFVCRACDAVGKEFEVNVPSVIGGSSSDGAGGRKRHMVRQESRPTCCVLCSHTGGTHAMHPLLDVEGPEGRQLYDAFPHMGDGKKKQLAWVHTLCASVIGANPRTVSSVYGCDEHGNFYGHGEDEEDGGGSCSEEEEFVDADIGRGGAGGGAKEVGADAGNREKACVEDSGGGRADEVSKPGGKPEDDKEAEEDDGSEGCTNERLCFFVIASEEGYLGNIRDHRTLTCLICKKKDKKYRLPVQCAAGDEGEYQRWKDRHKKGTECGKSMHVGCARWGCVKDEGSHLEELDGKRCRMCFFTPGRYAEDEEGANDSDDQEEKVTVGHCYCPLHARDIVANNPNRKAAANSPPKKKAKSDVEKKSPDRTARAQPRARPRGRSTNRDAHSSLKKSLNSIKKKKKKNGKRKLGSGDEGPSKKAKVAFAENTAMQFPVRGRSASALASSDFRRQNSGSSVGSANVGSRVSTPPPGVLRSFQSGPVPDLTSSRSGGETRVSSNGSSEQAPSGKRKTAPESTVYTDGTSKRFKMED